MGERRYRVVAPSVWDPVKGRSVARQVVLGSADPPPKADLYRLCVARRHGAGIAELGREPPGFLAPGSSYAAAIEDFSLVPELREVLAACRRLELAL